LCNATLLFHPMSVRVAAASTAERPALLGASLLLVMALSVVLGLILTVVLVGFRRAELIAPALAFLMAWQLQEGLRRGLLGSFWHAAAIPGDIATYGGQALIVVSLGLMGSLSVAGSLYAMAATALVGAVIHAIFLTLAWPGRAKLGSVVHDYWLIGGPASLGSGYLSLARLVVVPWTLAAMSGPVAAAGFQAAMNIVNLSNPLILGLGNIIPQAAASAASQGNAHAWHVVRRYVLVATPPIVLWSILIFAAPGHVLRIFYGAESNYGHVAAALQLLTVVSLIGFAIEAVVSFLHGITSVRSAAMINMVGTVTTIILAIPMVSLFGLVGGCGALLVANLARLVLTRVALLRVTAPVAGQPA